jgi:hypothetical protein
MRLWCLIWCLASVTYPLHAGRVHAQAGPDDAPVPAEESARTPIESPPQPDLPPPSAASVVAPDPATAASGISPLDPRTAVLPAPPEPGIQRQASDDESPTAPPSAEDADAESELAPRFGAPDSFMLSINLSALLESWSASDAMQRSVRLAPTFEYFVARNFALGLDITVEYRESRGYGADDSLVRTKYSLVSAGPRAAWNIPLGDRWSLYPGAVLGLHHSEEHRTLESGDTLSIASSENGAPSIVRTGPWVSVYVPLLLQAAPYFLLGFGPTFYHDFANAVSETGLGAERTEVGAQLMVAGFWGGQPDPIAPLHYSREPDARFGKAGSLVLTAELSMDAIWTLYSDTDARSRSWSVGPACDIFISDDVAIGGAIGYRDNSTRGYQPDAVEVNYDSSEFFAHARLRFHHAFSSILSWLPSFGVGFAERTYDEYTASHRNNHDSISARVLLAAPLLVHVASHYFIGIGPEFSRDLSDSEGEVLGTALGLSSSAGGWF